VNIPGAAVVGLCVVAAVMGGCANNASQPDTIQLPGKVIEGPRVVETVEVPGPTPPAELPLSCNKALNLAASLYPAMRQYSKAIEGQDEAVTKALAAMVDQNPQELNAAVDIQIDIKRETLPAVRQIAFIVDDLNEAIADCKKETP
jgi:hypothetical protein